MNVEGAQKSVGTHPTKVEMSVEDTQGSVGTHTTVSDTSKPVGTYPIETAMTTNPQSDLN